MTLWREKKEVTLGEYEGRENMTRKCKRTGDEKCIHSNEPI